MFIERGWDPVYLTDHIAHQWGGYRRTEVIESELDNLKTIITACIKVRNFKLKIDLLRAEISKRQSRRDILEKTHCEKIVWFE